MLTKAQAMLFETAQTIHSPHMLSLYDKINLCSYSLFADDATVLISHANPLQFKNTINEVYGLLDDLFEKNLLSLNKVKTRCMNFTAKKQYVGRKRLRKCWYTHHNLR
jgi:hypothetical protein